MKSLPTCLLAFALSVCSIANANEVTINSLLEEMVDYESVARYPEKNFRLKQHSSYNRASQSPEDEQGWFTNKDYNNNDQSQNFIRIEENNGQQEWVLMDHVGPGAIVRTWMPWHNPKNAGTDITMRIYLDGSDEPALEGNMLDMFNGNGVIPYPFAHLSLRSSVNFFPIPYAKSCKVTTDKMPFFFIFNFREYDAGTPIKTFTMKEFEAAKELTQTTGERLLNPSVVSEASPIGFNATLGNEEAKSIQLPAVEASVRELSVKLGNYEDPNITRLVILQMEFDGKETVWCPIGDFFGSGIGLNPVQGWYRTVAEDGTMSCRWVMPYQKSGKVTLLNLSGAPIEAELEVKMGPWNWDQRSMYFHAGWRGQYPVPTRPFSDWNYVTIEGAGVYVGDTLTIMNPVERWWGEGDEKIWVDGEDFPSLFGTGTEDYYAYSWGGRSTDFYEHPFHAQPLSHKYNKLNRKPQAEAANRNSQGYSVETRSRSLDTMPFASSLQLDMEIWHWNDVIMGYGVGAYWYGFANTTSNRKPELTEVLNVPPLPNLNAIEDSAPTLKDAVEINSDMIVTIPSRIQLKPQDLKNFKGTWNSGNHLLFKKTQIGDVIEIRIPAASPVAEKLTLYATKSYDFGTLRISVNGKPAAADIDLYASKPIASGPITLGIFEPVDSAYILRVEVVGKNQNSSGTFFGLDCLVAKHSE